MPIIQRIKGIKELIARREFWLACPVARRRRWYGVVFGFGLAGALWGWECYRGTVGSGDVITNPFSFILGAVFLGFFGSIVLALFKDNLAENSSRYIKKILKVVLLGTAGCMVGFVVPLVFSYELFLVGGIFLSPVVILLSFFVSHQTVMEILMLEPSLRIAHFGVEFLLTGTIIGLSYALILKAKIKPLVLRGSIGFALASIISPIIGNLIGNNLLNSLFSAYIITFALIGVIFGIALSSKLLERRSP